MNSNLLVYAFVCALQFAMCGCEVGADDAQTTSMGVDVTVSGGDSGTQPGQHCLHQGRSYDVGEKMGTLQVEFVDHSVTPFTSRTQLIKPDELTNGEPNPFSSKLSDGELDIICGNTPLVIGVRIEFILFFEGEKEPDPDQVQVQLVLRSVGSEPRIKHRFEHVDGVQLPEGGMLSEDVELWVKFSDANGQFLRIIQEF